MLPQGCPIEDVAADPDINDFIQKFELAKSLYRRAGMPEVQQRVFEELKLFDSPLFHLEMEGLYAQRLEYFEELAKKKQTTKGNSLKF